MWHLLRRWFAVLVVAALAGCGDEPDPVRVAVDRSRLFEQQRSLAVTVHNGRHEPVVLGALRFGAGRYESLPAVDRRVTVPADGKVTFPLPYGPARCDDDADHIVVHFELDGAPTSRRVPVSDPVLGAHGRECAAAEARQAVEVRFADDWEVVGPRQVRGTLAVTPIGDRTVEVLGVATSIVFVTDAPGGLPVRGDVPLQVRASRCDTHALIESKKTFTFTVSVAVDGGAPVPLEITPDDGAARDALQRALEDCLAAGADG